MKKIVWIIFVFLFFCSFLVNAEMLDDMEDNDNQNNWGGYWYTYDDLGSGGTSYVVPWSAERWIALGLPTPDPLFYMQSPGRTGNGYAARITGYVTKLSPPSFEWGYVGMGTTFLNPKRPVDLSSCTGVRFWHKGDGKQYRMKISSSHPNFVRGVGDDFYGRSFTTGSGWEQVDISMSQLMQEGWGSTVDRNLALSMSTDIQFQTVGQPHSSIELWIDEIEFYGCSSYPTPAVTPAVTNTWTNTPSGPTNTWTPTRTATSWSGTGTPTPTLTPAGKLDFDWTKPIISYPNPYIQATPVAIDFHLVKPAEILYFRLYTVSGRLIREVSYSKFDPNIINGLLQGKNTLKIDPKHLKGLSSGLYYYVLVVEDNTKKQVKSMVEKLIILKNK